jgi:hypothetical protein
MTAHTIDVKYHSEDTVHYCGAASAMMVLGRIEAGKDLVQQDKLYSSMHNENLKGWAVAPHALAAGLDNFAPDVNAHFTVPPTADLPALTKLVVQAVLHPDAIPPIVLLHDCSHYVVVHGLETDVAPLPGNDFAITRILIHDPEIVLGNNAVRKHEAHDACKPGARTFFTWAGWKQEVSRCRKTASFVGIFSNRLASVGRLRPVAAATWSERHRKLDEQDCLLTPDDAIAAALSAACQYMLADKIADYATGDPQLVQRIDRTDQFYYLVPVSSPPTLLGTAQIDAWDGELLSFSSGADVGFRKPDVGKMVQSLVGTRLELRSDLPALRLYDGGFSIAPLLVWRPCRQSSSPYRPFRQIVVGGRVLYLDRDGTIYPSLTGLRAGG